MNFASVDILDVSAEIVIWFVADKEYALPVGKPASRFLRNDCPRRQWLGLADARWQQDELGRRGIPQSRQRSVPIRRQGYRKAVAETNRRRAISFPNVHRAVCSASLSLFVEENRFPVRRNIVDERQIKPG